MIRVYSPEAFEDYRTTKNFCMFENHWLTHFWITAETSEKRTERYNKIMALLNDIHDTLDDMDNPSCYILKASDYVNTIPDTSKFYYADIVVFFQEKHYDKLNEIIDRYIVENEIKAFGPGGKAKEINPHWSHNNHPPGVSMKFGSVIALRREIGILRHLRLIPYEASIKYSPFDERVPATEMINHWENVSKIIEIQHRAGTDTDETLYEYDYVKPHSVDGQDLANFTGYLRQTINTYVAKVNNGDYGAGKTAVITQTFDPIRVDYNDAIIAERVSEEIRVAVDIWTKTEPQRSKQYYAMFSVTPSKVTVDTDDSVYFIIDREQFEAYDSQNEEYDRWSYNNYIKKLFLTKFHNNGSTVIQPSECIYSAELNGSWVVDLTHTYDEDNRYSYLKEGCVLGIDAKVARIQQNDIQFFRVFDVEYNLNEVVVTAYPVAFEAAFECPILSCDFCGDNNEGYTAKELAAILNNIQRNKFRVITDINSSKMCVWGEETNLQEILVGDQDATFLNMYGGEVVYDNYDFIINKQIGDTLNDERHLYYSSNMSGMTITINTWDLITRIEPLSSEGYSMVNPEYRWARRAAKYWFEGGTRGGGNDVISDDSTQIKTHPFVHAKVIKYDDVYLVKKYDKETDGPRKQTKTEKNTKEAISGLKNTVIEVTADYFDRARNGGLPESRISKKWKATNYLDPRNGAGAKPINDKTLRKQLSYGYLLYSWNDAKKYLADKAVNQIASYYDTQHLADSVLAPEEIELFTEAIQNGMNWCQKTKRAKWFWHLSGDDYGYYGNKYATDPSKAKKAKKLWLADRVENAMWYIDNYWFWFDENGRAIRKYMDWDTYEWFEAEDGSTNTICTIQEVTKDGKTVTEKKWADEKTKSYRFGPANDHSKWVKDASWWFERSATEHYMISETGITGNRRYIDKTEWIFSETTDSNGVVHTYYKSKDGQRYPVNGQFMYVSEKKGWYKFLANGEMIGPYVSKANFSWHRDKNGWYYGDDGGTKIKCQWLKINGKWFFFKADGTLDKSTDDYDENDPGKDAEGEKQKQLSIDWNREGVGGGTSTSGSSIPTVDENAADEDRDGVKAWIKKACIEEVAEQVVVWHNNLWGAMREDLQNHAKADLRTLTQAAITVEIDMTSLAHATGYEKFKFLEDVKLGDSVHVFSSVHNLDVEERVTAIKYDCLNNEIQEITLGYPKIKKSFINNVAKLHPHGIIQEYTPSVYLEDGYGGYLLTTDPADADVGPSNGLEVD